MIKRVIVKLDDLQTLSDCIDLLPNTITNKNYMKEIISKTINESCSIVTNNHGERANEILKFNVKGRDFSRFPK